jgi:hypothetical protein
MLRSVRWALLAALTFACALLLTPRVARADVPAPAAGTWGTELDSVAKWLAARNASAPCTEHCFVLTRLHLTGAADGEMKFSMEGAVVADRPVAVPLFGPPPHARVDKVTENGKPAAVGFEGDHWFVLTASRHFVVEGSLTLEGDLALTVPGPLDALDTDLSKGRVVEGSHLSGLLGATVHFDRDTTSSPAEEPPVFQLSRAIRIARETTFEYRLVMRSGKDLGVVRLPLPFGEKVLDVQGSSGWTIQGSDLVLPTAGHSAQVTVTGALASASTIQPDARSAYEWMLVESDAEHRLTVKGDARQVDASESPIARTQPSARLFLVGRGQHVEVSAQPLVATEALAAVVREHDRTLVLTARGDLVADDVLSYENDGIDWLAWPPTGRAVFLATDDKAERVMRAADGAGEVLVPLRVGNHSVHLQSMSSASIGTMGGWLSVPTPTHSLATSRVSLNLGLPSSVHPLAVVGGDRTWFAYGPKDALALLVSAGIALLGLRGRVRRILGAVSLGGLWLVSPFAWGTLVGAGVFAGAAWAVSRLLPRGPRYAVWGALGLVAFVLGISSMSMRDKAPSYGPVNASADLRAQTIAAPATPTAANGEVADKDISGKLEQKAVGWNDSTRLAKQQGQLDYFLGGENGRNAQDGGIMQGVAPVALPLPAYQRSVVVTRELVTRDRPLTVGLLYVTTTGLAPFYLVWLACIALLARVHGTLLARAARSVRERLSRQPEPDAAAPAPAAPPPVVA